MPVSDRLPGSLQENLLTLLVHSDEHGRTVSNLVDPALFEGDYRIIAERATDYWKRYVRAPGPHMADLLSDILESKHDRRAGTFRGILLDMLRLSESINAKYAIDSVRAFVKMQRFQTAVLQTARKLESQREVALPEVEAMWSDLLRARDATFDRGVTLNDTAKLIDFLTNTATEFTTGIPDLDARNIGPMRGAVMLLIASTGIGKSWGLIHLAKRALMQRKKVFYVSLEMSEGEVLMRFYQAFFSVTDRALKEPLYVSVLERDGLGKLEEIRRERVEPEFSLDSDNLSDELEVRRQLMQGKFKNIEIKRFPTRGLTVDMLRAYLDALEAAGFIPDVIMLDYIGIMKTDSRGEDKEYVGLGKVFEEFRGLCVERNMAGVTAQQLNRSGGKAEQGSQFDIAGAWSLAGTADVTLSISATAEEYAYGFARLTVEKMRRARGRFTLLITQCYDLGQFVLDSILLEPKRYRELFDAREEAEEGDSGDDED